MQNCRKIMQNCKFYFKKVVDIIRTILSHSNLLRKKTKSATTEAAAQKTQTPIVAKPIQYKGQLCTIVLIEFAFLSNS